MQLRLAAGRPCVSRPSGGARPGLAAGLAGAAAARLRRDRGAAHGAARRARRRAGDLRRQFHPRRRRQDADRDRAGADAGRRRRAAVLSDPRLWRQRRRARSWSMPHADTAAQVGDEALLLARVGADHRRARPRRRRGAAREAHGASVIVMDDGLQNASLAKDLTLAVVDGRRGIGNGRVFPAGPLRAPLDAQLRALRCAAGRRRRRRRAARSDRARAALPVFHGRLVPDRAALGATRRRARCSPLPASAIRRSSSRPRARPGIDVARAQAFPDHHRFTRGGSRPTLIMQAEHDGLRAAHHREGPRAHDRRSGARGAGRARACAAGDGWR